MKQRYAARPARRTMSGSSWPAVWSVSTMRLPARRAAQARVATEYRDLEARGLANAA